MNPDRINAVLARRIAAASVEREKAFNAKFSEDSFAHWIACARRSNSLRRVLIERLSQSLPECGQT